MRVRRATPYDVDELSELIKHEAFFYHKTFGDFDFAQLIETSYISIVATNNDEEILGFASFTLEPVFFKHLFEPHWFSWLETYKGEFTPADTLCLSLLISEPMHSEVVIENMLLSVSITLPRIDHFLYCVPHTALSKFTNRWLKLLCNTDSISILYCNRASLLPNLAIRQGREQDHDNLTPLLSIKDPMIFSENGEYFLAELLRKQNADNSVLVAKVDDSFVGLLCIRKNSEDLATVKRDFMLDSLQEIGDGNGARLTLYFIQEDFESRSIDMLKAAFEHYPDQDFLYITTHRTEYDIPLLEHFISFRPKAAVDSSEILYVVSKNALLGNPEVTLLPSHASFQEKAVFEEFLESQISVQSEVIEQVLQLHSAGKLSILSMQVGGSIVALVVVQAEIDDTSIRNNFSCDSFVNFEKHHNFFSRFDVSIEKSSQSCMAHYLIIEPVYQNLASFLLREMLRLLHKSIIFHGSNPGDNMQVLKRNMYYCEPRQTVKEINENEEEKTSTYITSIRHLSDSKVEINTRIVVVGASLTGISFINFLQKVNSLHFSNILLISSTVQLNSGDFAPDPFCFHDKEWKKITELEQVATALAQMKSVDRKRQRVICTDGTEYGFDLLVITTGRQFSVPSMLSQYEGVFPLNNTEVDESMLEYIRSLNTAENIMIYGKSPYLLATFAGLVDAGITADRLVLVQSSKKNSVLCHQDLESKLLGLIESLGAIFLNGWSLVSVQGSAKGRLEQVRLSDSKTKEVRVFSSGVLLYCDKPKIDTNLLKTIHHQSLAFDRRLILEPNFQTTDPKIYAAGPVARFSRRFGASENFENYSSREVGETLAKNILSTLGSTEYTVGLEKSTSTLPKFDRPICKLFRLPNSHHFFLCHLPNWPTKHSHVLEKKTETANRQTIIFIDTNDIIVSVSYFGTDLVDFHKLKVLVGMPWTFFNDLVGRKNEGLIEDFIEFLGEHWASVVFYDKFQELRRKLRTLAVDDQIETWATLAASKDLDSPGLQKLRAALRKKMPASVWQQVEREIIVFLREHEVYLPRVYHLPHVDPFM